MSIDLCQGCIALSELAALARRPLRAYVQFPYGLRESATQDALSLLVAHETVGREAGCCYWSVCKCPKGFIGSQQQIKYNH